MLKWYVYKVIRWPRLADFSVIALWGRGPGGRLGDLGFDYVFMFIHILLRDKFTFLNLFLF